MPRATCPEEEKLLKMLDAPDVDHRNWTGFLLTLESIKARVREISQASDKSHDWLTSAIKSLLKRRSETSSDRSAEPLVSGLIGERALFAAFAYPVKNVKIEPIAREMQAHFLICLAEREALRKQEKTTHYLTDAALGVRKFGTRDFSSLPEISRLSKCANPRKLYKVVKSLTEGQEESESEGLRKSFLGALRNFRSLLHYVDSASPAKANQNKTPSVKERHTDRLSQLAGDAELEAQDQAQPTVIINEPEPKIRKAYVRDASAPQVETNQDILVQDSAPLVRSSAIDDSQVTEAQASARAKRRADAIKYSLQPVPAKRSSLLLPALRVLAGLRYDRAAPLEDTQADVLLAIMFLTGCRPEEVRDVRIWKTALSAKNPDKFAIILDSKKFRIPVRPITEGWQPGVDEAHLYRKTQDHFFVSIPTKLPVARLVLDYGLARHKGQIESSWPTDPEDIKQLLTTRLKALNDQFHLSLTPVRVSGYLSSAVYALDGDAADALLLTGSRADKNDSRSFYYSPSIDHLESVYDAVWERLYSLLNFSALPRRRSVSSTHQCNSMCTGSQGVPKSEVLREISFKLNTAIRNAPSGRGSRVAARRYHNLVTAALSLQVFWMTGIRPARDVIEYRNYDASSGFLAVRDKDNEDESTVRLVYLIPELQAQIEAYDQHLRRLAARFEVDPDDLAFRVIVKARSGSEFRLRELEAHTGVKYPIRPNSHRHFLRTRLREKGVDGGYVDGLLGHGGIAGEVHGWFSAIAPGDIQRATSTPISELYREIALRPVF